MVNARFLQTDGSHINLFILLISQEENIYSRMERRGDGLGELINPLNESLIEVVPINYCLVINYKRYLISVSSSGILK